MEQSCNNKKTSRGQLGVISCKAGEPFGKIILESLAERYHAEGCSNGGPLSVPIKETHFPNSEVKVEILQSVRGMDLYIVQDCENQEYEPAMFTRHVPVSQVKLPYPLPEDIRPEELVPVLVPFSVNDNFKALLSALDAAHRSDVHYISAVVPAFPYARQDKAISREGITATRVAESIENHRVDRVLTMDIHNTAIQGFFRRAKCENLHASKPMLEYIRSILDLKNLVVVSPDEGGVARANYFAKRLGCKVAMGYKRRDYSAASKVEELRILGDVVRRHRTLEDQVKAINEQLSVLGDAVRGNQAVEEQLYAINEQLKLADLNPIEVIRRIAETLELQAEGLDVLFMDDMIATAGSLEKGVTKVVELGARSVWFGCALPLFTYPAVERIDRLYAGGKGPLKGVIAANAVYHHPEEFKRLHPWYHEVPVQQLFADSMFNVNHYDSISRLLE